MEIAEIKKKDFFRKLSSLSCIQRILLYGSRARGDNFERSDIDLAIDCPLAGDNDWLAILEIVEDADTLLSIDCVRYDTLTAVNPLKKKIDEEGVVLFHKGNV